MPLIQHDTLGALYVDPTDFKLRVKVYGCAKAYTELEDDDDDTLLSEFIALASRQIDAYAQTQGFDPEAEFSENHKFNLGTRRITVNNPPVVDLLSFKIRTGPQSVVTFTLTPVGNGPDDNPLSWGAVYYNRQENYLELSALSSEGASVSSLLSLGLMEVQAEILYRNGEALKPNIAAATAWQTAFLLNQTTTQNTVAANVKSMSTPEMSVTFSDTLQTIRKGNAQADAMHPMAVQLLTQSQRIAIA